MFHIYSYLCKTKSNTMSWFKKDKIVKTEEEIAQEKEKHIHDRKHEAKSIEIKLSPYIKTYCLNTSG